MVLEDIGRSGCSNRVLNRVIAIKAVIMNEAIDIVTTLTTKSRLKHSLIDQSCTTMFTCGFLSRRCMNCLVGKTHTRNRQNSSRMDQ